jgi:hypothetical protein
MLEGNAPERYIVGYDKNSVTQYKSVTSHINYDENVSYQDFQCSIHMWDQCKSKTNFVITDSEILIGNL